jgi:hypothetical protein
VRISDIENKYKGASGLEVALKYILANVAKIGCTKTISTFMVLPYYILLGLISLIIN